MRLMLAACAALLLGACALQPARPGPGAYPWGATPERVRAQRPVPPIVATPSRQVYHAAFAGIPATVVYHFDARALTEVVVINRSRHADRNRYIDDFERLAAKLRARHGAPVFEEMRWRNRLFADRPERYGDAVSAGHLAYLARWDTPAGGILMALRGERYQVIHELVFRPPGDA